MESSSAVSSSGLKENQRGKFREATVDLIAGSLGTNKALTCMLSEL